MSVRKKSVLLRFFYGDKEIKEHRDMHITDHEEKLNEAVTTLFDKITKQGYVQFRNMIVPWHAIKEVAILEL